LEKQVSGLGWELG